MNKKMFKLSAIQAAVLVTLSGCGSDNNNAAPTPADVAPTAANVMVAKAQQWLPVSGVLLGSDLNGDPITYGFMENGQAIAAKQGVYHFSHGQLTLDGANFVYTSISGQAASIDYTVTAGGKSASAKIEIANVANDPLAYQQWHLRNTGQRSYALQQSHAESLYNLYVSNFGLSEERARQLVDARVAAGEEKLVAGQDINVVSAYAQGVTGSGVTAVVVDSGMEIRHEDLVDNVLPNRSINLDGEGVIDRTDPTNLSSSGDHGTSVAGLIAAKGWNGLGGRGVAPDTGLIGMNYLGSGKIPQTELIVHGFPGSGISTTDEISTFNRSYGISLPTVIAYSLLDETIQSYPNKFLRDGKGALNVKSSGNSFEGSNGRFDSSFCSDNGSAQLGLTCYNGAFESSQSHPYYLSVAAVNSDGKHTSYSTAGANLMVSAPAGEYGRFAPAMVTTDQMTCINGYSGFNGGTIAAWTERYGINFVQGQFPFNYPGHPENATCNYTSTFNGTSSAAPNASGVISLILSANPSLTWRDVRHILASTSTKNDPNDPVVNIAIGEGLFTAHDGWVENAAGFSFNNLYGFGRVDAGAAVTMAKSYNTKLGEQIITPWQAVGSTFGAAAGSEAITGTIPDNSAAGFVQEIEVTEDIIIEGMQFGFDVSNTEMGLGIDTGEVDEEGDPILVQTSAGNDLAIEVISPAGTRSVLLSSKQSISLPALNPDFSFANGYVLKNSVFLSNAFYGESAKGTWKIKFVDTGDTKFEYSAGPDRFLKLTGVKNNSVDTVVEGVSLRAFGHVAQ